MPKKENSSNNNSWDSAIEKIEKTYGKGSIILFGEKKNTEYSIISTGSIGFDNALGIGGFCLGKIYEIRGWEGSGKSTICGHLAAQAQKSYPDKKVVYIDGEHSLDIKYFKNLGVDTDKMFISQPSNGEEGFNIAEVLIDTGEVSLCIIDSDTSLKPRSEVEGEIGDSSIGKKAKLNSQAYGILKAKVDKNQTCMVAISQYREKIGVFFGNPTTTSGGHALKFFSDCIIEVSKTLKKDGDEAYGNLTKIKIIKNKMAPPYKNCEFEIVFGKGIDKIQEIIELGSEVEIIKKRGNSIKCIYPTHEDTYTLDFFRDLCEANEEFLQELTKNILEKLNSVKNEVTNGELTKDAAAE